MLFTSRQSSVAGRRRLRLRPKWQAVAFQNLKLMSTLIAYQPIRISKMPGSLVVWRASLAALAPALDAQTSARNKAGNMYGLLFVDRGSLTAG